MYWRGRKGDAVLGLPIQELTRRLKSEGGPTLPVWFDDGYVGMLDQTRLPAERVVLQLPSVRDVAEAIREMRTRGSGAIACSGAYGMLLAAIASHGDGGAVAAAARALVATRPTAVALSKALHRILSSLGHSHGVELVSRVEEEVVAIVSEHNEFEKLIGAAGAPLVADGATILTICHAGALAGTGYGGRFCSIVRKAVELKRRVSVISMETRPYLQGARITAWELQQYGIPVTMITDGMAGAVLKGRLADLVITGSDRVAANGDVANKVGTYMLALAARDTGRPFYVSTSSANIDFSVPSGEAIPIESRDPDEVLFFMGIRIAPVGVKALYPSFDVTPARLIDGIITERGILRSPFGPALRGIFPEFAHASAELPRSGR